MIDPLNDVTLSHAGLTACYPRLAREAIAGQIAAIDAIGRRVLRL